MRKEREIYPMDDESLFNAALEKPRPDDRRVFLAEACAGDARRLARLEALLHAHEHPDSFLEPPPDTDLPALDEPMLDEPIVERPGVAIGPYQLLEQIGEGGFGAVFLAEQQEPVRRNVALKVLKPGMDTRHVIARFEAERQALALMDHPNIAHVFDGGQTASGRPYFVMELVKGKPITDYCDEHNLSIRQRLELFITICQAVQHAHQKGIIHRDLKPSNILVSREDGGPAVKVIDFGIAKATSQVLTDKTVLTNVAQMIGTPLYMSPEQVALGRIDVDTRSDIYSLGVMLYELLTGTTPFTPQQLREAGYDEMRRIIREEEPPRPSTRITTLGDSATTVSTKRGSDPRRLGQLLRGELDWIVMKCLEKDRSRRYESASALAADIERYLRDEPVQACPPSAWYRMRKFARRNKPQVIAAGLVLVILLAGVIGITWQAVRATRAEDLAENRLELAQGRLEHLEKATDMLASLFTDLDPRAEEQGGKKLQEQLHERLLDAARQLAAESTGDPEVVARLRHTLAGTLFQIGDYRQAIALLLKVRATYEELLGPDDPKTLACMNDLGCAYRGDGQADKAVPLLDETLARRKATLGEDDRLTIASMRELAYAMQRAKQHKKAREMFIEVLDKRKALLGPDHRGTLTSMDDLAGAYGVGGRPDLAVPLYEQVVEMRKVKPGPEALDTLNSINNLALAYLDVGQLKPALPLLEQVLQKRRERLDSNHPAVLFSMNNLAGAWMSDGQYERAVPLLEETLTQFKLKLGPTNPRTLTCMNNLAYAYDGAGEPDKSVATYEEVWKLQKARHGEDHRETLLSLNNLAAELAHLGRYERSLPLLKEVVRLRTETLGADHPDTLVSRSSLGFNYLTSGRRDEAIALLQEVLDTARQRPGGFPANLNVLFSNLARAYEEAGQFAKAEPLRADFLERMEKKFGPKHPQTARALALAGYNLGRLAKYKEAETHLRRSVDIYTTKPAGGPKQPEEWTAFDARSRLGGVLLAKKEYAKAEHILLEGYAGLKEQYAKIPIHEKACIDETATRLVQLYEATGEPAKAAEWRKKQSKNE
jgi:serine/threonine protein kinase